MNSRYVAFTVLAVSMVFSIFLIPSVSGQVGGPSNPNANVTTAYKYFQNQNITTTTPPIIITTDLKSYNQGDTIIMRGAVKHLENQTAITVRILSSLKNLISVAQLTPLNDGSFSKTVIATGPLWKDAGNYTVMANYGPYTQANATFYYSGGNGLFTVNQIITDTYHLKSGGQTYDISYIMKGGAVNSMDILADKFTLEITITASTDGSLTVTLPRNLIDSKVQVNQTADEIMTGKPINSNDLEDDKFIVVVGGKDASNQITETKTSTSRTISIPFHSGDTKIDIVGTQIVPEFGPIAALVLAIAIISIIAVSAKTGLRFMPKY
jgi:predicted secreted protein with PEFG-CTERM motif